MVYTAPRALPGELGGCCRQAAVAVLTIGLPRSIEGPIESMHPPQGVMPSITPHDLCRRDRSLLFTDTRSRVCSPSRLPRRRFTAPVVRRYPRPPHPALRFPTMRESPLSPVRMQL